MSPAKPAEPAVLDYFTALSNWGRWGDDDQLGTLNHITPAARRDAAALVREGRTVSCAWDIDPGAMEDPHTPAPQRFYLRTGQGLRDEHRLPAADWAGLNDRQNGAREYLGLVFHGYSMTHLDALSHIFWDARMYNGHPAELVTSTEGATVHAVTAVADGIVTRGVLVDAARHRDVRWLEPGEGIGCDELAAILEAQGTGLQQGDAVLLRTGTGRRRLDGQTVDPATGGQPGWQASCLPVFHERGVAVVGADTSQDVIPSGYDEVRFPIHAVGMAAMGLFLIDNCNLEDLAAACQAAGRWEFLFTVAPLRVVGGSGSPVNPLATL